MSATATARLIDFAPRSVLNRVLGLLPKRKAGGPWWHPRSSSTSPSPTPIPITRWNPPWAAPAAGAHRRRRPIRSRAVDEYDTVIEHIYDYAEALGLEIDTIIQEAGAAQLEVNLRHGDPMELADQVFHFKRLIREAALRCGCYATFMAKPYEEQPGSAMHIHQSVVVQAETGETAVLRRPMGEPSERSSATSSAASRHYLRAACCLMAPYVNSYRRLVPGPDRADQSRLGARQPHDRLARADLGARKRGAWKTAWWERTRTPTSRSRRRSAAGYLGMIQGIAPRQEVTTDSYEPCARAALRSARGGRGVPATANGAARGPRQGLLQPLRRREAP